MLIERISIQDASKLVGYKSVRYFKETWVFKHNLEVVRDEGFSKEYLILSEFLRVFNAPSLKALTPKNDSVKLSAVLNVTSQLLQARKKDHEYKPSGRIENEVLSRLLELTKDI